MNNNNLGGEVRPLLDSCLTLGSSLLQTYLPDGNRRPNNNREDQFQRDVEDFFRNAACSNYGNEIFNNYKFSQRQEPFQRDSVDIVFHKADPTVGIIKTKVDDNVNIKKELVELAQSVVTENENMKRSEEIPTETESQGEETTEFPS